MDDARRQTDRMWFSKSQCSVKKKKSDIFKRQLFISALTVYFLGSNQRHAAFIYLNHIQWMTQSREGVCLCACVGVCVCVRVYMRTKFRAQFDSIHSFQGLTFFKCIFFNCNVLLHFGEFIFFFYLDASIFSMIKETRTVWHPFLFAQSSITARHTLFTLDSLGNVGSYSKECK